MSVIAHIAHIGITFTIAALCPDDGWARPSDRCFMSFHVGCTLPMSCVYNDKIRSVFTVFKVTRIHCAINAVISVVSKVNPVYVYPCGPFFLSIFYRESHLCQPGGQATATASYYYYGNQRLAVNAKPWLSSIRSCCTYTPDSSPVFINGDSDDKFSTWLYSLLIRSIMIT